MLERLPLALGFAALALAIGLGSVAVADGIRDRNRRDVITVTGSARRAITSDYIVWDAAIASQRPTPRWRPGSSPDGRGTSAASSGRPERVNRR